MIGFVVIFGIVISFGCGEVECFAIGAGSEADEGVVIGWGGECDGEGAGHAEGGVVEGEVECACISAGFVGFLGDVVAVLDMLDDGDGFAGDFEGEFEAFVEGGVPCAREGLHVDGGVTAFGGPVEWDLIAAEPCATDGAVVHERSGHDV